MVEMVSIRRFLASFAAVALLTGAADAADLPLPEAAPIVAPALGYDWTGFYVGLNAGWGWGDTEHFNDVGVTTDDFDMDGFVAGGQIGYNFQWNWLVLGAEADIQWSDIDGSTDNIVCFPDTCATDIDWFGTVRGRAGVAFNRLLIYGTGGLAYGEVDAVCCGAVFDKNDTNWGWTAGGGVEVGFTPRISFKAEYLFVDLDDVSQNVPGTVLTAEADATHIVRAGFNWRFGGGP
jgi:outer membrane immunogenic protein